MSGLSEIESTQSLLSETVQSVYFEHFVSAQKSMHADMIMLSLSIFFLWCLIIFTKFTFRTVMRLFGTPLKCASVAMAFNETNFTCPPGKV